LTGTVGATPPLPYRPLPPLAADRAL